MAGTLSVFFQIVSSLFEFLMAIESIMLSYADICLSRLRDIQVSRPLYRLEIYTTLSIAMLTLCCHYADTIEPFTNISLPGSGS